VSTSSASLIPTTVVEVARPKIVGDTVTFAWEQSVRNPFQRANRWSMRYDGIDLARFAPELLLEVFLALQLKVWAAHPGQVEIRLPRPMPAWTVAFWTDYHRATNLQVAPLAENRRLDPWPGGASGLYPRYDNLVFFGGGKDSGAAASLLAEIGGPGSTLLLSHTASLDPRPQPRALAERRIVEFIQKPVSRATGLPTARFWTDYLGNWRRDSDHVRPFLEFFPGGTLPLLVAHDVRFTTFGHGRNEYHTTIQPGQSPQPARWSGRPETLAAIGAHYRRAWGLDIDPASVLYPVTAFGLYRLLRDRYPAMYDSIVSCSSTDQPWCYACLKCFRHLISTLAHDAPTPGFDYDATMRSQLVDDLVRHLALHEPTRGHAFHPAIGSDSFNQSERISQISLLTQSTLDRVLAPDTRANLTFIRTRLQGEIEPTSQQVPRAAIAMLPAPLRQPMTDILGRSFELVDDLPDRVLPDGSIWIPQWRVPMTLAGEVERLVPAWAKVPARAGQVEQ
jgi:hypothetical protein